MRKSAEEIKQELASAVSVQDAMPALEALLSFGYNVGPNGQLYYIKELVGRINGLSIYVYPKDHPPPHFHIRGGGLDAVLAIQDCRLLKGQVSGRHENLIRWWHQQAKHCLLEAWERNQLQ